MCKIEKVDSAYYRILFARSANRLHPWRNVLFRIDHRAHQDSDGAEGMGYTFAVNHGGPSIHAMIERDLERHAHGRGPGPHRAPLAKDVVGHALSGRGGIASFAIAAVDIALWDLMAKKAGLPCGGFWAGMTPRFRPMPGVLI
jgi:L-alanine-DL-glutamate epimerase-like enolase superfamily enzyme